MPRQYATVRNPTPADFAAAIEAEATASRSLDSVTYTVTSSAADSIAFSVGGLAALSTPATNDAVADASSLIAAWLADANYLALVSTPSRVTDNEDGSFTVTYRDQGSAPAFVNSSSGANSVVDSATGGELVILSAEVANGATLPFVGDAAPFAVTSYTSDELKVRRLMNDFIDWPVLDEASQDKQAEFIAAKDVELGRQLQGAVLVAGWQALAVQGATPVEALMQQQLHTSYAASAANNGALFLAKALIERIPDAIMSPVQKGQFVAAIDWHTQVKWPRPVDQVPQLPPQVVEQVASFDYSVYVPAYIVDASAGDVTVTLPPLSEAGVLPYWWTRIVCRPEGNTITFAPDGAETIDGSATLAVTTAQVVVLGGGASEWKNLA